jgi:hypothetical protein
MEEKALVDDSNGGFFCVIGHSIDFCAELHYRAIHLFSFLSLKEIWFVLMRILLIL